MLRIFSAAWIAFFLAALTGAAQERVVNTLSAEQMEQLLKGLSLEFKKSVSPTVPGHFYYDFSLGKRFSARLHYFKGKDIMLDALFGEQSLETLNRWNATRAKVTRASLRKDAKGGYTAVEANLNIVGGVTDSTVRRFVHDFEEEIAGFDRFVAGKEITPPVMGPDGDKIFAMATNKLEEIITSSKPKKQVAQDNTSYYDYDSPKNYKIRLTNFGNQELKLDAVFKKIPLETLNRFNFKEKFVRAVLYSKGNVEYTALEANLDCSVGVSENMIRHFMITFEEDVQTFIEFISKN